uniref:Ig-like domain-containing protein n=1 Tax=Hydatigena taeniaeformis TaxID=6205 RepID=A0A0R3XD89_HYDTA
LLENARVLRITEVNKEEDEADYRCTAMLGDMTDNITITLKVSRAPRIQDLPGVQRVQGGRQSLTFSCATQNHADKPWYAWWRFQPEGFDKAIDLPPDAPLNPGAFQVSYAADLHQTEHRPLSEGLRRQLPKFVHSRPNSVVHVRIEQLNKRQHQGTLTCKIVNEVGYDERPIRVTFIRTGDFKELDSLAERTEGRIYQEPNGTLVISQVEESDPRKFLCFLTPKESTTATPISVAVNLEIHGMLLTLLQE